MRMTQADGAARLGERSFDSADRRRLSSAPGHSRSARPRIRPIGRRLTRWLQAVLPEFEHAPSRGRSIIGSGDLGIGWRGGGGPECIEIFKDFSHIFLHCPERDSAPGGSALLAKFEFYPGT